MMHMYNWKTTIQTEQIKNEFCVGNITYPMLNEKNYRLIKLTCVFNPNTRCLQWCKCKTLKKVYSTSNTPTRQPESNLKRKFTSVRTELWPSLHVLIRCGFASHIHTARPRILYCIDSFITTWCWIIWTSK